MKKIWTLKLSEKHYYVSYAAKSISWAWEQYPSVPSMIPNLMFMGKFANRKPLFKKSQLVVFLGWYSTGITLHARAFAIKHCEFYDKKWSMSNCKCELKHITKHRFPTIICYTS